MPIEVQRFVCQQCLTEYDSFSEASLCESAPMPEARLNIGDTVTFEDESNMMGSRWCYSTTVGRCIGRDLVMLKGGQHGWLYICQSDSERAFPREYGVMWVERDMGWTFFSASEWKYKPGFAAARLEQRQRIGAPAY